MDAIDLLQTDIDALVSGNTVYTYYQDYWQFLFESYMGGEEYRRAGHLVKYQNESPQEYSARINNTPLQNHCASVIQVFNGFLFRVPPARMFGSMQDMPQIRDFLKDADLDGRSFNAFMKDVATYASIFGHAFVIVTKPDIGALTLGEERDAGVRPYVNLISPLMALDWSWNRAPSGRYTLDYFKYIEEVNGSVLTLKEWTPTEIRTTVIDRDNNKVHERIIEPNGLGVIPVVIAYNKRSIVRGIGISDIADIADAQKFIYNATSEIDQSIRLDSHPSLVKTPETNAGVGAGAIIHMPENLDPGLKPFVLDHAGASIPNILSTIESTIQSIDKMANTGAVRATESRVLSGVAMETEFSLLNARLSEKGDNLELAEEQIWRLWAQYMGMSWDGDVYYPDSFNLRDAQTDLETYLKASTAPLQTETFKKEIAKQIAELTIQDDMQLQEIYAEVNAIEKDTPFRPHIMVNPDSGAQRIANTEAEHLELSARGYIHPEGDL